MKTPKPFSWRVFWLVGDPSNKIQVPFDFFYD
jgi:hypothetical protein